VVGLELENGIDEIQQKNIIIDSSERYMLRIIDGIQDLRILNNCEHHQQIVQIIHLIHKVQQNIINYRNVQTVIK